MTRPLPESLEAFAGGMMNRLAVIRFGLTMALLLSMALRAVPAFCQDPPDVGQGTSPSVTYHGSDFDFVDMTSGRLHLHIPLFTDHSQRGGLNSTYSLSFTSTGAFDLIYNTHGGVSLVMPTYGFGNPWLIQDDSFVATRTEQYVDRTITPYRYYYAYSLEEADGSMHPLSGGFGETIDGSGAQDTINAYIQRDGVRNGSEDTNGNELTNSITVVGNEIISTTTDTLGRTWTRTDQSSDVSGCPTVGGNAPIQSSIWTIPGPTNVKGGLRTYKLCYARYTLNNGAAEPYVTNDSVNFVTAVILPDGTNWRFNYDNTLGDLIAVYPPTGGSITYSWETVTYWIPTAYEACLRVVTQRTVTDNTGSHTWTYNPQTYKNGVAATITVTDPLLNDTVYTQGSLGVTTQIDYYLGHSSGGTLIKTVEKSYDPLPNPYINDIQVGGYSPGPALLTGTVTKWANGQQSEVLKNYDSGFTFTDPNPGHYGQTYTSSYGLVTSETHYDYGNGTPGSVISVTTTSYKALTTPAYAAANILDLPTSVVVTDGNTPPNVCAETDYGYDEYTLDPSSVSKQHVAAPNPVMGNQTSVTRQYFSNPCTSPTPTETPYKTVTHFYDTGMKHTVTDPNQNTTTYAYSPTFYGAFVTQTTKPSTSSPNPANHVISGNYDFNTGLLTSFTDENSNTTNYTYDVMLRPTNVTAPSPDGGQTNFYYPNTTTVEMKKQIDSTRWTDSFVYYDGLGREIRHASINDEPVPYDQIDTCYDADGRVGFKTYPYQGNGGAPSAPFCSKPGDAFAYDPLNRVTQVTHSDNSTVLTSYTGRATSAQDEGNGTARVQRISQVDGMGRLTSVCEVDGATQQGLGATPAACNLDIGGTGFLTTYAYNPLGDLTSVSQGGYLPRSFTYDSLSRLVTSLNPEAGTMSYTYDPDGNVITKTDARNITTCFGLWNGTTRTCNGAVGIGYDALNRLLQKTYSDTTPSVAFHYDETSALGVSGLLNTDGRASSSVVAGSQAGEVFSYDKLGRTKINSQCTPQNCGASAVFPVTYTYDLLGDTLTATNGTGVTLTYPPYNRALRIMGMTSSLSDSNHPGTLYSSLHYNAAGSVASAALGNSGSTVNETRTYDGRLRLAGITDGSIYNVSIPSSGGYAPDGDILQAVDSSNGTWSYMYDEMNRLCSANKSSTSPVCHQSGLYQYKYDRFGNMWTGDGSLNITFSQGNNNHIDNLISNYDAAGNLLNDGVTAYTYDSESRIITTANNNTGVTASYEYDAEGRRIRKTTSNGGTVDFLYDLGGHEISQITSAGAWTRGEIYAGGRHLGTYVGGTSGNTYFTFSDWIGTERARSVPGATTACETITSLPFGDGLATAGSCGDPSPMHLTGKERDAESGLDYFGARYDSSQYGRFMTPDWAVAPEAIAYSSYSEPQPLNRYAYCGNNPVTCIDRDGHCEDFFILCAATAVAALGYGIYKLNKWYKSRQAAENSAFDKSMACMQSNAACSNKDIRAYDQERINTYGEGAVEAITDTVPDASPATDIPAAIGDVLKDKMTDRMVEDAKREAKRQGLPDPNRNSGQDQHPRDTGGRHRPPPNLHENTGTRNAPPPSPPPLPPQADGGTQHTDVTDP